MNMNPYIEEIEKRFDEKFAIAFSGDDFQHKTPLHDDIKTFFRAELPSLLSKFAAEINVEPMTDEDDSHHRSVAEKAGEIIKQIT